MKKTKAKRLAPGSKCGRYEIGRLIGSGGTASVYEAVHEFTRKPVAFKILSLRTFVYALFGFGMVGTLLSRVWGGENALLTGVFAGVGGAMTGVLASAVFGLLKRSDSGERLNEQSFVGLIGKVTLPIGEERAGQVSVFRGDRRYTLRALPHGSPEASDPEDWGDVVVVEMDGILEAAAIGIPHEKSGEAVKVFAVRTDDSISEQDVIDFCQDNLTGYKRPKVVEFRDELPKTNVGKILRRALRDE